MPGQSSSGGNSPPRLLRSGGPGGSRARLRSVRGPDWFGVPRITAGPAPSGPKGDCPCPTHPKPPDPAGRRPGHRRQHGHGRLAGPVPPGRGRARGPGRLRRAGRRPHGRRAAGPDVVVCDIAMPKLSGLRVADALTPADPQAAADRRHGVRRPSSRRRRPAAAGFDFYLAKPADPFVIETLIRDRKGRPGRGRLTGRCGGRGMARAYGKPAQRPGEPGTGYEAIEPRWVAKGRRPTGLLHWELDSRSLLQPSRTDHRD